jgi:hypothetical protein
MLREVILFLSPRRLFLRGRVQPRPCGRITITQEKNVTTDETTEQLAIIVGEMPDRIREKLGNLETWKLGNLEAEGITCVPISDARIILTEHYNLMHQLIYEAR